MLRPPGCQCSLHQKSRVILREGGRKAQYFHGWAVEFGWFGAYWESGLKTPFWFNTLAEVIAAGAAGNGLGSGGRFGFPMQTPGTGCSWKCFLCPAQAGTIPPYTGADSDRAGITGELY